jgi:hypothetical protein
LGCHIHALFTGRGTRLKTGVFLGNDFAGSQYGGKWDFLPQTRRAKHLKKYPYFCLLKKILNLFF